MARLEFEEAVTALRAAAEPTRLRLIALLSASELNVKDISHVLGQSQPRISRHLKLLADAGLIERYREGSWVYLRLAEQGHAGALSRLLVGLIDPADPVLKRDRERADALKAERAAAAQAYFARHAAEWDNIRRRHVDEAIVEATMRDLLAGDAKTSDASVDLGTLVDLGTGTGRTLELLADRCTRGIGLDVNPVMLANARTRLETLGLSHIQLRQGDIYNLSLVDGAATTVVMHQVLHFLTAPGEAVREAGRILAPGGRLMIVDFAAHDQDELREAFAHQRLGFTTEQLEPWLAEAGLVMEDERTLVPGLGVSGEGLTVKIWLSRRIAAGLRKAERPLQALVATTPAPSVFETVR